MAQSLEKALAIAADCARAKRIAGLQADVAYSQYQLCETIETLLEQFKLLKDEATLANRRFAASNARYQKLALKTGKSVAEEETE